VLQTGNTSLGVNMLAWLVEEAARRLGEDWDIEIVETHHRMKVDALRHRAAAGRRRRARAPDPSGRPRRARARWHHREARGGDHRFRVPARGQRGGDHTVHFLADNERLSFSHLAENRGIFARGALKGALWLIGQKPGRYGMKEVLGL
jgi:4-hydroxy-tetrahydrodipicolinate reductase